MKFFGFVKSKIDKLDSKLVKTVDATKAKLSMISALGALAVSNFCFADFDPTNAITLMVKYASAIVSGVGVVYAIIAVFNWVSAIKQEDSERASKAIVNVFIAGLLIAIGPIVAAFLGAFGASSTYGLG